MKPRFLNYIFLISTTLSLLQTQASATYGDPQHSGYHFKGESSYDESDSEDLEPDAIVTYLPHLYDPLTDDPFKNKINEDDVYLNKDEEDYIEKPETTDDKSVYDDDSEETTECRRQRKARLSSSSAWYLPRCTVEGDFEAIQCVGPRCFCVDAAGVKRPGFSFQLPQTPQCPPVDDDLGLGLLPVDVATTRMEDESQDVVVITPRVSRRNYFIWVIVGVCISSVAVVIATISLVCLRMMKKDEGRYKLCGGSKQQYYEAYEAAKAQQIVV